MRTRIASLLRRWADRLAPTGPRFRLTWVSSVVPDSGPWLRVADDFPYLAEWSYGDEQSA